LTEQAFQNYLAVMMVSLLALFPGITMETFGVVTLTVTASWSLFVAIRFYQAITQGLERWAWIYPSPYVVPDRIRYSPRVGTLHGAKMRRSVQLVRRVNSHSALFGYRIVLGIA
jgi:hypothetical protein